MSGVEAQPIAPTGVVLQGFIIWWTVASRRAADNLQQPNAILRRILSTRPSRRTREMYEGRLGGAASAHLLPIAPRCQSKLRAAYHSFASSNKPTRAWPDAAPNHRRRLLRLDEAPAGVVAHGVARLCVAMEK